MRRLALLLLLLISLVALSAPALKVRAQGLFDNICDTSTSSSTVCQDKGKSQSPTDNSFYGKNGILIKVVRLYAIVTGIAAVIMIIVSGFKLVTSSGDPNNVKSAKNTFTFAIAGLVVAALATLIVQFILNRL